MEEKVTACKYKETHFQHFISHIFWFMGQLKKVLYRCQLRKILRMSYMPKKKSNMQTWAEREIELACKRERGDSGANSNDWDYGCACYESAYKAYKSLMGDGHSGFSIGMTQHILNRLIDGKPLTPIEDTNDVWNNISHYDPAANFVGYQCKRMSALFKDVYSDGRVKYKDIDAWCCVDLDNGSTYHSGLVQRLMDEMYPISMPYCPPDKPAKVYCSDLLTDHKNGDFDTVGVFYMVKSDGERVTINRFFKEVDRDWKEITGDEYVARKELANALV